MPNLREAIVKWTPNGSQPTTGQQLTIQRTDEEGLLPLREDLAHDVDSKTVDLVELGTYTISVVAKVGDRLSPPATLEGYHVPAYEIDAPTGLTVDLGGPVPPVEPPTDVNVEALGPAI